jgi:2-phosphoglycerate kinase
MAEHSVPWGVSALPRKLFEAGVPRFRAEVLAGGPLPAGEFRYHGIEGPHNVQLDGKALERPLVVMVAGTAGVGKSTLATLLAHELGVTRVIATDAIREVVRAFFSPDDMPTVHCSSFEAGDAIQNIPQLGDRDLMGFLQQASAVRPGIRAIISRAAKERTPVILEGVHMLPGVEPALREACVPVEAVIIVDDEADHRGHFLRRGQSRAAERYLRRFAQIRKLQSYLVERAVDQDVPVIHNANLDEALERLKELTLSAVECATQ